MLPIAAIMVLNKIEDMSTRLNFIILFTGAFSLLMNGLTTATLQDIFQATAA